MSLWVWSRSLLIRRLIHRVLVMKRGLSRLRIMVIAVARWILMMPI